MERLSLNGTERECKKSYSVPTVRILPFSEKDILKTSLEYVVQSQGDLWDWEELYFT